MPKSKPKHVEEKKRASRSNVNHSSKKSSALHRLYKTLYIIAAVLLALAAVVFVVQLGEGENGPRQFGVTFREPAAKALGLDWQVVYTKMLDDLHVRNIRLPVYWDDLEKTQGQYVYNDIDMQMNLAGSRNASVVMSIGRRVPGWPECHIPDWAAQLSMDQQQAALMKQLEVTVNRYKNNQALKYWQVENEPYLTRFGTCPTYPVGQYLTQEIDLVHKLDPNHKVIVTENGEISVWVIAASHGDIFATTLYRKVYAQSFHKYVSYHFPPWFFRFKKGLVHLFLPGKDIWDIEMQAEPWTTKGFLNTDFTEQAITYPQGSLADNLDFAYQSGFATNYLWGVEYWYWAEKVGHPEFLQEARTVLRSGPTQ